MSWWKKWWKKKTRFVRCECEATEDYHGYFIFSDGDRSGAVFTFEEAAQILTFALIDGLLCGPEFISLMQTIAPLFGCPKAEVLLVPMFAKTDSDGTSDKEGDPRESELIRVAQEHLN